MAKSQKHGNKEAKKPKAKKPAVVAATPATTLLKGIAANPSPPAKKT